MLPLSDVSLLWVVAVHEFQSYVVNPDIGRTIARRRVTLPLVAVVAVRSGGLAVILAAPFTSAVASYRRRRVRPRATH